MAKNKTDYHPQTQKDRKAKMLAKEKLYDELSIKADRLLNIITTQHNKTPTKQSYEKLDAAQAINNRLFDGKNLTDKQLWQLNKLLKEYGLTNEHD